MAKNGGKTHGSCPAGSNAQTATHAGGKYADISKGGKSSKPSYRSGAKASPGQGNNSSAANPGSQGASSPYAFADQGQRRH